MYTALHMFYTKIHMKANSETVLTNIDCHNEGDMLQMENEMQLKTNNWKQDILYLFPPLLRETLSAIGELPIEEIRIRAKQPIQLCFSGFERLLYLSGKQLLASAEDCAVIVERACEHSVYAWQEELKNGFLTLAGGHRIGICGKVVKDGIGICNLTDITSLNIRIARACPGAGDALIPKILRNNGTPYPTLIISPPGCGKTTILRDLIRQLSYGLNGSKPMRITVIDERMELAGCVRGVAQHDLGPRTDILSGCSKPEGIRMAVRALSPEVLATDELGSYEEAQAIQEAAFCGVITIASAHVAEPSLLNKRRVLLDLLESGAIERLVLLGRHNGKAGHILGIFDHALNRLSDREGGLLCFER